MLAAFRTLVVLVVRAEGLDDLFEARNDGGVRQAELLFDVFDLASALEEDLDEGELLARQPAEPTPIEVTFDGRVARVAFEARDPQRQLADGAFRRSLASHEPQSKGRLMKINVYID